MKPRPTEPACISFRWRLPDALESLSPAETPRPAEGTTDGPDGQATTLSPSLSDSGQDPAENINSVTTGTLADDGKGRDDARAISSSSLGHIDAHVENFCFGVCPRHPLAVLYISRADTQVLDDFRSAHTHPCSLSGIVVQYECMLQWK